MGCVRTSALALRGAGLSSLGLLLLFASSGCDRSTLLATSRVDDVSDAGTTPDGGAGDAEIPVAWDGGVAYCGDHVCACSNGVDDDGDGAADGWDSECTGPFDDDESSFATGLEKPGSRPCLDCFFDANTGAGDDDCRIAASCLATGSSQGAPGACNSCTPSAQCVDTCLTLTPNGCDCFGCCVVELEGESTAIQLSATCSTDVMADESKCPRCMPSTDCFNPCETCELCTGKGLADLPASCAASGGYVCEAGAARCDATAPCNPGEYCSQGCCIPVLY